MTPEPPAATLTIREVTTRAVAVPMTFALGTSADRVATAPLLLVDLRTEEGPVGRTYLFTYRAGGARAIAAVIEAAVADLAGQQLTPVELAARLARSHRLIGVTGLVRMALSALDTCLWDALAQAAGLPLASLLGAPLALVRAYNSCGLGLMGPDALAREAEALLAGGFEALKLRLGYPTLAGDLAAVRAVRAVLPAGCELLVDYNQGLDLPEALRRGRALDEESVAWLEEPIRHDDLAGYAALADALRVPIQIGENFDGPKDMAAALAAGACDLVMPDLARIGGVGGWMQAAGIAAGRGIPMSSHLFPEVSAHLLVATPTRHLLEYVDWAAPILDQPLAIEGGHARLPNRPGNGLAWDEAAVARYAV